MTSCGIAIVKYVYRYTLMDKMWFWTRCVTDGGAPPGHSITNSFFSLMAFVTTETDIFEYYLIQSDLIFFSFSFELVAYQSYQSSLYHFPFFSCHISVHIVCGIFAWPYIQMQDLQLGRVRRNGRHEISSQVPNSD